MNNRIYLYGIGTACAAIVSASLLLAVVQDTPASAQNGSDLAQTGAFAGTLTDRSVRVILASPYGR